MKKEKTTKSFGEESSKETSGLKKLIKKVLTDKTVRSAVAMSAFLLTVANVGASWLE